MKQRIIKIADNIKKLSPAAQDFFKLICSDITKEVKTYEIVASLDGLQAGIKCLECNMTSWNPNDVKEKYCGNCHEYHHMKAWRKMYPYLFINQ